MGNSTYTIQGEEDGGWKSRLEFPLNSTLLEIKESFPGNASEFELSLSSNFSYQKSGKLIDSDWLYKYRDDLAIYSSSDSRLNVFIFNAALSSAPARLNENINFKLKAGYKYEYFSAKVSNTKQKGSYDGIFYHPDKELSFSGETLDYNIDYYLPYLGLIINAQTNKLLLKYGFNYSPLTSVRDRDIHILRNKTSRIKASGQAFWHNLGILLNIYPGINISGSINYTKIDTAGTQLQKYDSFIWADDISARINSEQIQFKMGLEYIF